MTQSSLRLKHHTIRTAQSYRGSTWHPPMVGWWPTAPLWCWLVSPSHDPGLALSHVVVQFELSGCYCYYYWPGMCTSTPGLANQCFSLFYVIYVAMFVACSEPLEGWVLHCLSVPGDELPGITDLCVNLDSDFFRFFLDCLSFVFPFSC